MPHHIVILSQPDSEAGASASPIGSRLRELGFEVYFDSPEQLQGASMVIVAADSASNSAPLLEQLARRSASRTRTALLLGVANAPDPAGAQPNVGTVTELLEHYQVLGLLPIRAITAWRSIPSGFIGRKDLMARFQTNCMKDTQSTDYCLWVKAPGESAASFIAALAQSAETESSGSINPHENQTLDSRLASGPVTQNAPSDQTGEGARRKLTEEDLSFYLNVLAAGRRDDRVFVLQNLARSPTGDPRVSAALIPLLEDTTPCLLQIPYRFGEVRLLAGAALAAEHWASGAREAVRLHSLVPLTADELERMRREANVEAPPYRGNSIEQQIELLALLRARAVLPEADWELYFPVHIGWLGLTERE